MVFKLIEGVAGESENVELGTATEIDADIGEDWPQAFCAETCRVPPELPKVIKTLSVFVPETRLAPPGRVQT